MNIVFNPLDQALFGHWITGSNSIDTSLFQLHFSDKSRSTSPKLEVLILPLSLLPTLTFTLNSTFTALLSHSLRSYDGFCNPSWELRYDMVSLHCVQRSHAMNIKCITLHFQGWAVRVLQRIKITIEISYLTENHRYLVKAPATQSFTWLLKLLFF